MQGEQLEQAKHQRRHCGDPQASTARVAAMTGSVSESTGVVLSPPESRHATEQALDLVFGNAVRYGLTSPGNVLTMRRNIESGRFTPEHYIDLWGSRLEEKGYRNDNDSACQWSARRHELDDVQRIGGSTRSSSTPLQAHGRNQDAASDALPRA